MQGEMHHASGGAAPQLLERHRTEKTLPYEAIVRPQRGEQTKEDDVFSHGESVNSRQLFSSPSRIPQMHPSGHTF